MPSTKRIDGDYQITTLNLDDNVIINTNTVEVNGKLNVAGNVAISGNLDVSGNVTYINVSELNIRDPFILLNSSNTGSYAANSGVLTHITSNTFAGIRYNDTSGNWEVSSSTDTEGTSGSWQTVVSGNVVTEAAGNVTEIQFNGGPTGPNPGDPKSFNGSPDFTFDAVTTTFTLQGHMVYGNIVTTPTAVANSVAVYHKRATDGGSGLYVKSTTTDSELVTNQTAILLSIIF
jgi:hypothetical protein